MASRRSCRSRNRALRNFRRRERVSGRPRRQFRRGARMGSDWPHRNWVERRACPGARRRHRWRPPTKSEAGDRECDCGAPSQTGSIHNDTGRRSGANPRAATGTEDALSKYPVTADRPIPTKESVSDTRLSVVESHGANVGRFNPHLPERAPTICTCLATIGRASEPHPSRQPGPRPVRRGTRNRRHLDATDASPSVAFGRKREEIHHWRAFPAYRLFFESTWTRRSRRSRQ
jgi:hypothetical protein